MDEFEFARKTSVVSMNENKKREEVRRGLKGDYGNLCVLLMLYILQGIPMGLLATIPMIFSSNKVPYELQAIFTFAGYPYAIKLLWAPIVDSLYSERFGRRKSWLIPAQYLIGAALLIMSPFSDDLIGNKNQPPQIYWLTLSTFIVVFLVATQDVAVDAWGLTLLSKRNVHYVASCNAVGVTIGSFLTSGVYMALESPKFCNDWLRKEPKDYGIVNIQQLFFAIGIMFALTTTIIWVFKKEEHVVALDEKREGIINTYKLLLKVIKLRPVLTYILIQMTQYVGCAVFWAAADLKLIQFGVRREILALLKAPISILNMILPFIIVHMTKNNPLHHSWRFGLVRQLLQVTTLGFFYWTQTFNNPEEFPLYYYAVFFVLAVIFDIIGYTSGMASWAFMMTVADPQYGATYMTLFATIGNIGVKLAITVSLALLDPVTIKRKRVNFEFNSAVNATFNNETDLYSTQSDYDAFYNTTINSNLTTNYANVERVETVVDGFYIQGVFCLVYGLVWYILFKKLIWKMQAWPESKWRIKKDKPEEDINANEAQVKLTYVRASQIDDDYL